MQIAIETNGWIPAVTYDYESLLDEHFQNLSQSLLLDTFPRLQCLPVGMPDGGRDALTPTDGRGTIVFQVKFARNPTSVKDPVEWVTNAIDGELDKIMKLIARGATEYILITNMPGTSHLDSGRIDKIASYLRSKVPIPSQCWWRDELDRRLDRNFDLKLRYPSLLTGADLLRLVWERGDDGARGIENNALRAYLTAQLRQDETVRFKQAELSGSKLFQIFVDVPVAMPDRRITKEAARRISSMLVAVARSKILRERELSKTPSEESIASTDYGSNTIVEPDGTVLLGVAQRIHERLKLGAAETLLDATFYRDMRFVVLEGAPGQGKSTLTQYIGQVQRTRLLQPRDADQVPVKDAGCPVAVPLRIELRDVAQWLKGLDPWQNEKHGTQKSLEAALVGHIRYLSGGADYSVNDLHFLVRVTPVHLLLDGLDEVADLEDRRKVVDEVLTAIARIDGIAKRLNVLVTSRPTAISGTAAFPAEKFVFLRLAAIDEKLALEYTDRWCTARNLEPVDRREVRTILKAKMGAPHMRELAKNTMQLSILLSLIYLRGSSLPDKRTELYDTYVDTFLNRESEKSEVVRRHRRLLIDMHRYLAFYLHANAEGNKTNGRIRSNDLRKVMVEYLAQEDRDPDLVDELVIGTVERIVVLVSRVEGTYEFEVQPLREYFAARYLYDTAPYSPAGRARVGTKPDRFDAVARNPYWLNVARFLAGCFSKGELLDLAERVCSLIREYPFDSYPRSLALAFLQDWVFNQSVSATNEVVAAVFDEFGIVAYGQRSLARRDQVDLDRAFVLSEESGGRKLADLLFARLKLESVLNSRVECLCDLLVRHMSDADRYALWIAEAKKRRGAKAAEGWFWIGLQLGAFEAANPADLEHVATLTASRAPRLLSIAAAGDGPVSQFAIQHVEQAVEDALRTPPVLPVLRHSNDLIAELVHLASPHRWLYLSRGPMFWYDEGQSTAPPPEHLERYSELASRLREVHESSRRRKVEAWRDATLAMDREFGPTWTTCELAVICGALVDPSDRGAGANMLLDINVPTISRVRYAKRNFRKAKWWIEQAALAVTDLDKAFWLLTAFTWGDPFLIQSRLSEFDRFVRSIGPDLRSSLANACFLSPSYSERARRRIAVSPDEMRLSKVSFSTLALLSPRMPIYDVDMLIEMRRGVSVPWIATALERVASTLWAEEKIQTDVYLDIMRECHRSGGSFGYAASRDSSFHKHVRKAANDILADIAALPNNLVSRAASTVKGPKEVRSIMSVANEQGWIRGEG